MFLMFDPKFCFRDLKETLRRLTKNFGSFRIKQSRKLVKFEVFS